MSGPTRVRPEIKEIGVTELYNPSVQQEIVADLVIVHGLKGHPLRTWDNAKRSEKQDDGNPQRASKISWNFRKNKGKEKQEPQDTDPKANSEDNCYWPFDLLPQDFKNIRILIYGYDSHPTHFYKGFPNRMTISQHGRNLLDLTNARSEHPNRPLIFVAHSLGGILVKEALVESKKYIHQPRMQQVSNCCTAILFFGTPHQGSGAAEWGLFVSNIVNTIPGGPEIYREILRGLSPDSEKLENLTRDFNDILNSDIPIEQKIKICSFQEGKGVSSTKGFSGKVVPDKSSAFGRRDIEVTAFINENHMNMCRFKSRADPGYETLKANLSVYLLNLQKRTNYQGNDEPLSQNAAAEDREARLAELLQRLEFDGRCVREDQLWEQHTHQETFQWIWATPFAEFLSGNEQLFWICGKPASGKSTLLHYLWRSDEVSEYLARTAGGDWNVVHYFFDFRAGNNVRNSLEGLLRSLLYQLFSASDFEDEASLYAKPSGRAERQWNEGELRSLLLMKLKEVVQPTCILLDGLDEYQGSELELVQFLRLMVNDRVKLCLASRPSPTFNVTLEDIPMLRMQDFNISGIRTFIDLTLNKNVSKSSFYSDEQFVKFSQDIAEKANGVFLWARFAVFEVAQGWAEGEDLEFLAKRIEEVPQELEDIYSRLFARLKQDRRQEAGFMLRLVCFAQKTLKVEELLAAMQHISDENDIQPTRIHKHALQMFERRLLSTTAGVLELFSAGGKRRKEGNIILVDVIHRTIRTYLDKTGWLELLGVRHEGLMRGHVLWLRVCAKQFPPSFEVASPDSLRNFENAENYPNCCPPCNSKGVPHQSSQTLIRHPETQTVPNEFAEYYPLRHYAAQYMLDHAEIVERQFKISTFPLIHHAMTYALMYLHSYCWDKSRQRCECTRGPIPRKPLHLVIGHRLDLYISDYLSSMHPGDTLDVSLHYTQVSRDLEEYYFVSYEGEESPDLEDMTLLECAVYYTSVPFGDHSPRTRIVESILEHQKVVPDGAIITALRHADQDTVRLLLKFAPSGKLRLRATHLPTSHSFEEQNRWNILSCFEQGEFPGQQPADPFVGPLWVLTRRGYLNERAETMENLIDTFLERGEDINGVCGPFGTVLHGFISSQRQRFVDDIKQGTPDDDRTLKVLLDKGADVNALGPFGTALDFAWFIANTHYRRELPVVDHQLSTIKILLEKGARNNVPDPNGKVPTAEWMARFCEQDKAGLEECQDIFFGSVDQDYAENLHDRVRSVKEVYGGRQTQLYQANCNSEGPDLQERTGQQSSTPQEVS